VGILDIKLRARLSAYSKVNSMVDSGSTLPDPSYSDGNAVLGVTNGEYKLIPSIGAKSIDTLFTDMDTPTSVEKSEIDTLFKEEAVPESVNKDEIDSLFNSTDDVGTVSYSQIDSLFR
jgi:hypothetical protein